MLPTPDSVLIVAGAGRSGTSLVMQMLAAAGVPVTGEAPAYENEIVLRERATPDDWRPLLGYAVKVLDPWRFRPPALVPAAWVLLTRDPAQQAASMAKFLGIVSGLRATREDRRRIEADIPHDDRKIRRLVGERKEVFLTLRFEDLINDPRNAAGWLANFIGRPDARAAMQAVVRPRSAMNYPGLMEIEMVKAAERAP